MVKGLKVIKCANEVWEWLSSEVWEWLSNGNCWLSNVKLMKCGNS